MTIGESIQAARKSRGLSQEQLAGQLNVSRQAVSKWERGDSSPDAETILVLADALGVSCDVLLRGAPDAPAAADAAPAPAEPCDAPAPRAANKGRASLICAIVFSGIGALGLLTICVLSTMIESRIYYTYMDASGSTWYTSGAGYSLEGFIEVYRLQALLVLLGLCLAAGVCLFLARGWKRIFRDEAL